MIIDIQNDYFAGGNMALVNPEKAGENAKLLLEKFRSENGKVVHIQHIATKPDATFFLPDTLGAQIHRNVLPSGNEKVVEKHFPNSFHQTELLVYLTENEINDLVVCGMMTHMCIDATVRAAKDSGFNCTLISDACATRDLVINDEKISARDVHNAFLAALNSTYASVKTTREFIEKN